MRKTIAFLAGVVILAAVLSGTGCKSRDVKGLALALGPVPPAAAPVPPCGGVLAGSVTVSYNCSSDIFGDTVGASGPFTEECYTSGMQRVYQINLTRYDILFGYMTSCCSDISMSLRRSCDPENTEDVLYCGYEGSSDLYFDTDYLDPGTYYLVIDTMGEPADFYFYICPGYAAN